MSRFICLLMLICGLSPLTFAQEVSDDPVQPKPSVRLTWEEIDAKDRAFPFDAEVNACIERDRYDNRGIGEPCMLDFFKYCPEEGIERPGTHRARSCYSYFTDYWNRRLETAYADIVAHYEQIDGDKPAKDQRTERFETLQVKWKAWRNARCSFIPVQTSFHSPWAHIDAKGCVYDMTAMRALELENLRLLLSY